MKRLPVWAFALSVFAAGCLALPAVVKAEVITNFDVDAQLNEKREATFTETIGYDFEEADRHGIYRDIPVTYDRDGGTYRLRVKVLSVLRDGRAEPYSLSSSDGQLRIKIGDADRTITGPHVYRIVYSTDRAINFFQDHSELYWNVTGDRWNVPIEQATFSLHGPVPSTGEVTSACFVGVYGSTESTCDILGSGSAFTVKSKRVLQPYEGMTVVFGFPTGTIHQPTILERVWQVLVDNRAFVFPLSAFAIMFALWWKKGRDPELGAIIPEYEAPEGLTPAVVSAVHEQGEPSAKALTATIIDLARRGFLKINMEEKKKLFGTSIEYTFVKQPTDKLPEEPHDRTVLSGLFQSGDEQTIAQLKKNKFYVSVQAYKKQVSDALDALHAFDANPMRVRGLYTVVAVLLGGGIAYIAQSAIATVAGILTGLIILGFGWMMPRPTASGSKLIAKVKGFKWFMSVTEKERLDFHNAPERKPEQFMELLPWAIALGVEEKWAQQFASLNIPPPDWAQGSAISHLNTMSLVSNLDDLHHAAQAGGMYAPPSQAGSGGSGFSGGGSGGGFGGGGGGSW